MCKYEFFGSNFLVNIDKYVNRKYLNNDKSFTRARKLSLKDVILYPLLQEGHTNSREANNYMKLITGDDFAMISQQAIGEKRGFINPEVYEDMYKDYVDELYNKFYQDLTLKDYMILAGDTTVIKVPNVSKTKEEFPVAEGKPARARLSMYSDAITGFVFDAKIVEKKSSEVYLAIEHLKNVKNRHPGRKILVTYDRGYNSFELMFKHMELGVDFLIRLDDSTLHKEIEQLDSDDEILRLYLNNKRTKRIKDQDLREKFEKERYVDLRVTRVEITNPKGETYTETLLSTLKMDIFSKEDLKELYNMIWTIETDYDRLKNILEMENFTGQRRIIIEQDIYSKIFLLNLLLTFKKDADEEIQQKRKDKKLKHEYQGNLNHLLGVQQTFLYKLINCNTKEERKEITDHMIALANQRLVLKKDKRKKDPERHTGDTETKYQSNNRRSWKILNFIGLKFSKVIFK